MMREGWLLRVFVLFVRRDGWLFQMCSTVTAPFVHGDGWLLLLFSTLSTTLFVPLV
jgi:hypothetical protein